MDPAQSQNVQTAQESNRVADALEEMIAARCDHLTATISDAQRTGPAAAVRGACNRGMAYFNEEIAPAMGSALAASATNPQREIRVRSKVAQDLAFVAEMYAIHGDDLRALHTLQSAITTSVGTPLLAELTLRREALRAQQLQIRGKNPAETQGDGIEGYVGRANWRYRTMILWLALVTAFIIIATYAVLVTDQIFINLDVTPASSQKPHAMIPPHEAAGVRAKTRNGDRAPLETP